MDVALKPELERFLQEQVQLGRFPSTTEAIEAAIARLMLDPEPDPLDEAEVAELRAALDEMEQGRVVDLSAFARHWREKNATDIVR